MNKSYFKILRAGINTTFQDGDEKIFTILDPIGGMDKEIIY